MMKKKLFNMVGVSAMVLVLGLVLTSCMSMMMGVAKSQFKDHGSYDSSVPADQLCDFRFMFVNIKSFDGKPVSWKNNGGGANNTGHIKVPAGAHNVVFDWIMKKSNTTVSTSGNATIYTTVTTTKSKKDIPLTVNFTAGHNYLLGGGQLADGSLKIHILDQTSMPSEFYGDVVGDAPEISKIPTEIEGSWKANDGVLLIFAGNTWEWTLPPGTAVNEGTQEMKMKGTFEATDGVIKMYMTDTYVLGRWIKMSAMKQAYLLKYSLAGSGLDLELEGVLPVATYLKQ
jgi:hypothetical protein